MSTNSPIKVLFLGSPNSGKTTLINGFIGKDVLPESMCRSTRIRTYIGGADNNSDCVFLFDVDSTIPKRIDAKNFIDYSYPTGYGISYKLTKFCLVSSLKA